MRLDTYLRENGLSAKEFGKLVGLPKQTIHNYRHGFRFPGPENLLRIKDATNGAVTPDDFIAHVREVNRREPAEVA